MSSTPAGSVPLSTRRLPTFVAGPGLGPVRGKVTYSVYDPLGAATVEKTISTSGIDVANEARKIWESDIGFNENDLISYVNASRKAGRPLKETAWREIRSGEIAEAVFEEIMGAGSGSGAAPSEAVSTIGPSASVAGEGGPTMVTAPISIGTTTTPTAAAPAGGATGAVATEAVSTVGAGTAAAAAAAGTGAHPSVSPTAGVSVGTETELLGERNKRSRPNQTLRDIQKEREAQRDLLRPTAFSLYSGKFQPVSIRSSTQTGTGGRPISRARNVSYQPPTQGFEVLSTFSTPIAPRSSFSTAVANRSTFTPFG